MAKQLEAAVSEMEKLAVFDAKYEEIIKDNFGEDVVTQVKGVAGFAGRSRKY